MTGDREEGSGGGMEREPIMEADPFLEGGADFAADCEGGAPLATGFFIAKLFPVLSSVSTADFLLLDRELREEERDVFSVAGCFRSLLVGLFSSLPSALLGESFPAAVS